MNEIISKINELQAKIEAAEYNALQYALQIGKLAEDYKTTSKHGEFCIFIKSLNVSRTTIFRYMELHRNKSNVSQLKQISEAYKVVNSLKQKDKSKNKKANNSIPDSISPGTATATIKTTSNSITNSQIYKTLSSFYEEDKEKTILALKRFIIDFDLVDGALLTEFGNDKMKGDKSGIMTRKERFLRINKEYDESDVKYFTEKSGCVYVGI